MAGDNDPARTRAGQWLALLAMAALATALHWADIWRAVAR